MPCLSLVVLVLRAVKTHQAIVQNARESHVQLGHALGKGFSKVQRYGLRALILRNGLSGVRGTVASQYDFADFQLRGVHLYSRGRCDNLDVDSLLAFKFESLQVGAQRHPVLYRLGVGWKYNGIVGRHLVVLLVGS